MHPGYGFLSENEDFARRVEEQGIVFIGPKHHSIAAMGDKIASKKLALEAKVNTIPGWNEAIETPEQAVQIAKDIGYPVMIKASAGGGGKGLRVAFNDKEAFDGFSSCRNEAKNSFGDDRVFIEKFVESPRHIEIQVLGDAHGHIVYLHERECSIQRRHQKVIEEAPSPFISEATRKAMGEQAVALARAVKYQSAGTVEFVVGKDQSFYFLEMNTRLQVEHPVTESITGIDLVEQMIRVAAGEKLPFAQADIPRRGWAMECRINAEDPFRGFLPSTGRLVRYLPPVQTMEAAMPVPEGGGVRVDTGVYEGGEIPMYYDSMIAKLIVHGLDRDDAIAKMREALNGFVIRGVSSNIPFQAALLAHPKFVSGDFNTGFIAEHYAQGFRAEDVPHDDPNFLVALAAAAYRRYLERAAGISGQLAGHHVTIGNRVRRRRQGPARRACARAGDHRGRARDGGAGGRALLRHRQPVAIRRHPRQRQLQRPALHRAGRAPRPVAARRPQRPAHRRAGDDRARRRAAAPHALQGAAGHEPLPAVADARAAGRHRGQARAGGAGRRAAGGDRGDEDGEHPHRRAGRHRGRGDGRQGREPGGGSADPAFCLKEHNDERQDPSASWACSRSPSAGPTSSG